MVGLLDPLKYGEHFYELYTSNTRRKLQNDRKSLSKRKSKDKKAAALAAAAAVLEGNAGAIVNPMDPPIIKDQLLLFPTFPVAHIELEANASKFAIFAVIRSTVLEAETRYALFQDSRGTLRRLHNLSSSCCLVCAGTCMTTNLLDCSCHSMLSAAIGGANGGNGLLVEKRSRHDSANSDAESESEEATEKEFTLVRVPLIVGAGLRSLFELIAEARHIQPMLCTKALKALLDVIQGQQPESFKLEPDDLINPLYDLLLDLTTMPAALVANATTEANWSAMACAALIGLCIARGDTGKILKAIAAMLMSPKQLSTQIIQLPAVLSSLQRTVMSAALNKPTRPDFHTHGIPVNSLIDEFSLKTSAAASGNLYTQPAMASDGTYLYLLLGSSLLKIGTGFSGSFKGHIYAQNDEFTKEKTGWLGHFGGNLYFRRNVKRSADHLHLVNKDTLTIKGINSVNLVPIREGFNYVLFTDEDSINAICTNRDDTLVVKKLNFNNSNTYGSDSSPPFELPLKLARKKFRTLGYAAFEDEVLNQNQIQKIQSSYNIFEPKLPSDVEIHGVVCGKEFGLVRASNGKVYYYGKSASLGLKSIGRTPTMKMTELIISKVSNIVHIAVGHDGIHALLVNDDGTVYFTGTARRGEDGDSSKNRRQPKAVKPKKMSKIDGHVVIHAACNNGTSAFVTKTGKLIMFGKDTAHCDASGCVSDFIDQHITKVALGKAHCVALNSKGQLFTFGLNNKGQCGRVFSKSGKDNCVTLQSGVGALNVATTADADSKCLLAAKKLKFDFSTLCDYDDHQLVQGQCRVCVMCRECTGYNVSCVSTLNVPVEERLPGAICPCGHGDAGCSKCGLCSTCISLQEAENDANKDNKQLQSELNRQRSKSLIMRRKEKKTVVEEHTGSQATDTDKDPPRVAPLAPQMLNLPSSSPVVQVSCGLHHTVVLTLAGEVYTFGSNQYGQLGTGDLQPVNGPVKVHVQGAISQVCAGSNHTVLMTYKGMVYTFGNYQKGQLGRLPNDFPRDKAAGVGGEDACATTNKTACGEHGVANTGISGGAKDGCIANLLTQRQKFLWHCAPGAVFGLGPSFGKKATWIGASGDQTFIKIDESLITTHILPKVNVVANKKTILLIPTIPLTFHTLSINRRDGSCTAHYRNQINFVQLIQNSNAKVMPELNQNIAASAGPTALASSAPGVAASPLQPAVAGAINEQMSRSMHEARNQIFDLHDNQLGEQQQQRRRQRAREQAKSPAAGASASGSVVLDKPQPQIAFALDPHYNVLWVYDGGARKLQCYNVLASEIANCGANSSNFRAILSPELALPNKVEARISRSQASLNLLACLDILTSAQDAIPTCFEESAPKQQNQTKESLNNEYQIVNRFDNFGGGWGYSGHSVESIRFSADTDVMICGFGMFGGRGEYTCKLKLFDLGTDGGGYEKEGVLISETKEVPFECAARSKHHIMLPKPINAAAGRWYLIWARIAGPSSDCGSCGQASVTTEDQVVFTFKSSKKANNGTDVNSGQIPCILYRLITQESKQPTAPVDVDPVQKITKSFANTVSKECFESLVVLLNWSWETFKTNLREQREKGRQLQVKQSLAYLIYVNKSCLRLLRKYTNEIYPQRASATFANTLTATSIANALTKLQTRSGKSGDAKDKNSKTALSNSTSTVIANNVAKYFGETSAAASSSLSGAANGLSSTRKPNMENIQLAECIGNVRALLISIFCDDIFKDICNERGFAMVLEILEECHISFVACFDAFYPTSSLKWNCLCDLLSQMDKQQGTLHSRLLSAILAGLCSPSVKLRTTFSLLNPGNERQSIISPSDNSGLPMLSSTEAHQYPILVEQMIYRTQQEKADFLSNSWTFKDVLVRLLDIIANPIRARIENIYNRSVQFNYAGAYGGKDTNQGLIDNCCHLLARVLAEIVYQTALGDYDKMFMPPRSLHSTGSRFARCDQSRTWNTGNFGPDAIGFTVDRPGIAIAGAMVFSGSGSYDYQLELLYDNTVDLQSQHKWETLESVSGSYDQDVVHNDMTEVKFERPVHIKENARYALRLCSQGARTCSGDAGMPSIRGPCGTTFQFYSCDLSFNGTTPQRGQIPCILYYSTPLKSDASVGGSGAGGGSCSNAPATNEVTTRDTALQIASDITKKCTELLILARNALAASLSPSDNSSNHTQTIDSEHNITPIEEHMDINWANNSRTSVLPVDGNISTARDITKRIESFSKGIIETLKFDKRSTNPFEMEIEIGATEIHPKDLMIEETTGVQDLNFRNGQIAKLNGNERVADEDEVAEEFVNVQHHHNHQQQNNQIGVGGMLRSESEDVPATQLTVVQIMEVFNMASSNMFHTLLPLVYAHVANLACSDPKSSVQILGMIKEILPHIAALNQLYATKDQSANAGAVTISPAAAAQSLRNAMAVDNREFRSRKKSESEAQMLGDRNGSESITTSNHYCVVESEHPYRSATISCQRVEFPPCVQWLTIEFDPQCGTAQLEDYLLLSIPMRPTVTEPCPTNEDYFDMLDNNVRRAQSCTGNALISSCYKSAGAKDERESGASADRDWIVVKKFNTSSNWMQNVMILPGNCIEFSLETSSLYAQDPHINRYGFKCLVVGYDNPSTLSATNSCLIRLEQELAYLGGMCSANLMKKDLNLPDDKDMEDLGGVEDTINAHHALLSKGFALSEPVLTVHQALESYLPIGSQSNERQFLKDFISGAPGSSGARLAAWLQPESRLDPNKCELNTITEPLRYGWPTQITVTIRDQYGDAVLVPELKVEIKAIPTGASGNGNIKMRRGSYTDNTSYGGVPPPPRLNYEPTIKEKMCFKAITFMKPYGNYSFEELRFSSPIQTRITETLYAQDMEDGTFSVHWTPNSVGSYCLTVNIDGILLEEVYRVEVKEGGLPPPSHKQALKKPQPPNKLRKFFTKNTAGLRIRSHPTLQSEQVGIIKLNGVISFIDEIENDDGVWLRLSTESIRQHCTMGWYPTEAWCLQYNQHFGRTLLHPVAETSTTTAGLTTTTTTSTTTGTSTTDASVGVGTAMLVGGGGGSGKSASKPRHKVLLDNVESPVSPVPIESPSKVKSVSPNKKIFDFSQDRFTPPKSSELSSHTSTNPFLFPSVTKSESEDSEIQKVFDMQSSTQTNSTSSSQQQQQADLLSLHSLQNTSPSQIGSAIAGVVGGGAIKLQALQKWFKGDTLDGPGSGAAAGPPSPAKEHQRKRSDVTEVMSTVSVRELVRVMGGQDTRCNGNSAHAQGSVPRSSSPVQIPATGKSSTESTSVSIKSTEASETSGLFSSLTQDSSSKELDHVPPSAAATFDISTIRVTSFTASQTAALLSTPKHSPRKLMTSLRRTTSPSSRGVDAATVLKEPDLTQLEDDMSMLQITTTTTGGGVTTQDQILFGEMKTASTTASTDDSSPPVWPPPLNQTNVALNTATTALPKSSPSKRNAIGPIKRAMPPSLAESIRAVFAAFLWHEGLVHDAMACASFLKFHPSLPKEGATVVTRRDSKDSRLQLSREQKAQQRHSVEVANAGTYLNIRPSTLETLTKSGNSSLNNRKHRKNLTSSSGAGSGEESEGGEKQKLHTLPEVVTVLPPALRCLVYLWEQVCTNCVQVMQSNIMEREKSGGGAGAGVGGNGTPTREASVDAKEKQDSNDRELAKKIRRKKKDDGSWCEICEVFLPIPVTYHMRIVHPGCGKSAKGKGYNSVGIFCEGWAGNCGEGGKGASSWFLMCDECREKYMTANKNVNNVNSAPGVAHSANELNLFGVKTTTLIANSEIYTTMRENATFLLELSSSASTLNAPGSNTAVTATNPLNMISSSKRSPQQMPVVVEHQHFNMPDLNKPSTSRGDSARNSRISLRMSGKFGSSTPYRKSFVGSSVSPEHIWLAPETFACLESLGVANNEDLPYEMFGLNATENGFDRPLSEMSYESCDPNNYEIMTGSMSAQQGGGGVGSNTGTLSKFHRSFSMGQGWALAQQQGTFQLKNLAANADETQQTKVVFRRRNNSTSEGDGALLICYPSENLRRLVPENILNSSIVHPAVQRLANADGGMSGTKAHSHSVDQPEGNDNDEKLKTAEMGGVKTKEYDYSSVSNLLRTNAVRDKDTSNTLLELELSSQVNALLQRPAMAFITQKHDLEKLRYAMKRSLRIAACRIYSLQALNWLLRSVTQSICLHDLMWWFVSSLTISAVEMIDGKYEDVEPALEHPVTYTQISGRFSHLITQSLHVFLQSVADLTLYLPLGSPLQRIAIQCFGIRFRQTDHQFLHNSHVFGNISKILSKSDEQDDVMAVSSMGMAGASAVESGFGGGNSAGMHDVEHNFQSVGGAAVAIAGGAAPAGAKIVCYSDLNGMFEVTVSSRQAMAESLTDNSTETFWESDEEDRNKCKIIEISMTKLTYTCKVVLVHIDNSRDIQNKVLNVVFYAGQSLGDTNLIKSVDVDPKACAWISAKITNESYTHFRLEFHGPENTLRVRQIKLLGLPSVMSGLDDQFNEQFGGAQAAAGASANGGLHTLKSNLKLTNALRIQQQICESETLRVFRLITGQVFGKLISNVVSDAGHQSILGMDSSGASMLADSLDLREHMVGILFSRSKLSHLQKQVIVHIVHAIKKEAHRAKEDWEIVNLANCFKEAHANTTSATSTGDPKSESSSERYRAPDTYCFEMLSMVLALSGSVVGRSYLSHQYGLLKDLLTLLHTGSDRVQRQVTALLRRILPEISPESFAELMGVQRLPPADYNIAHQSAADFDMNRLGLLDIFLAVIAKALQLQVKVKSTSSKSSLEKTPSFVRLCNSLDLSVHLLKQTQKTKTDAECEQSVDAGEAVEFSTKTHPFRFDQQVEGGEYELGRSTLKASKKEHKKNLNQRWFLNGVISTKQAESIISLVRDLASGKLSEKWSQITKAAIAESVLNLTRLDEIFRNPEHCVKTASMWLALASLCVLDRDHVEKLSSGQWSKVSDTRPMCTNHDDGETAAIIQCETCGSLCGDCDRFLHLNRKTRMHKRTVCKEEEEAIRVELHESCGRTKLFWLLALADSKTLKAMVEFRDGSHTIISGPQEAVGRCRFCGITGNSGLLEIGNVCADAQCQEHAANSCMKVKSCDHPCGGVANEKKCLPCLQHVCHARENKIAEELHEPKLTQDADDMCMICFVEALSCAPSIQLECGHVFHYHCSKAVIEKRWSGPRITFGFSLCPICKADIQHALLADILEPINALKQDVKRKALMRLKYEGIVKDTDSKDVTNLAMDRYAYYVCYKCQKAYYGGEARCDAEIGEKFDPQELVCGGCSDVARAQMCPKHGTDFLEYKCRYCCSVAVFFCFGTTHFCDTCHDDFQRLTNIPKNKLPQCPAGPKAKQLMGDECPLHVIHPPTGEEFALGCGVCRNAQTF
ncbi:E3 ubiquitin-protein ligase highwire isoform X1 [Zeugodacus cucurbitae]|uniref:E3 ubiquitin-protein ligase highwire isoform X1 n=1 Tax=Zeugodacus cucurbitae TaxID=28588 RepID=UPI0023D91C36|nr:E3 ubiquitin-protein ligase highwire isoform X1 [Zeugodacus cucurbitae]